MALMCHPHFAGTARPSKGSGKRRNPFGAELFRVRPLRLGRDRTGGCGSSSRPSGRGGSQDARGLIHGALAAKQARILWAWWVTGRPYQPAGHRSSKDQTITRPHYRLRGSAAEGLTRRTSVQWLC